MDIRKDINALAKFECHFGVILPCQIIYHTSVTHFVAHMQGKLDVGGQSLYITCQVKHDSLQVHMDETQVDVPGWIFAEPNRSSASCSRDAAY